MEKHIPSTLNSAGQVEIQPRPPEVFLPVVVVRQPHLFRATPLALAAVLGACLALSGQSRSQEQAPSRTLSLHDQQQLKAALASEDAGQLQEAQSTLQALLRRNPESFEVIESLGLVLVEREDYAAAAPLLQKATRLAPHSAVALANLGAVHLKLNHPGEAAKALQRAVALDPHNAQTQTNLGLALMQANDPALAAQAFEAAASLSPQDGDVLYNWSIALLSAGKPAKAAEVIARVPDAASSAQVQSLWGDIAERQDQFKEAVQHYEAAIRLDPSEANIYTLGMEFVRHWTFDPAIKIFDDGLSRYPESARLQTGKGIAKYANNNYAEAATIFSSLLIKDPNNPLYAEILGHSCNLMPDAVQGCDTLVDFAEKHPSNAPACTFAAASILHRPTDAANQALAQKLLDRAIAADPRFADAYFQLGVLKQQQSQWNESKAALEKAVELKPALAKAHYRLALAYSHTGQRDKAKEEFALQQQYSQMEKDEVNARLKEVTTFLVSNN